MKSHHKAIPTPKVNGSSLISSKSDSQSIKLVHSKSGKSAKYDKSVIAAKSGKQSMKGIESDDAKLSRAQTILRQRSPDSKGMAKEKKTPKIQSFRSLGFPAPNCHDCEKRAQWQYESVYSQVKDLKFALTQDIIDASPILDQQAYYYLTEDITLSHDQVIQIVTSTAILDLNNHTLQGNQSLPAQYQSQGISIYSPVVDAGPSDIGGVVIRNGTVSNFINVGIYLIANSATNILLDHIVLDGIGVDVTNTAVGAVYISLTDDSRDITLNHVTTNNCGGYGLYVEHMKNLTNLVLCECDLSNVGAGLISKDFYAGGYGVLINPLDGNLGATLNNLTFSRTRASKNSPALRPDDAVSNEQSAGVVVLSRNINTKAYDCDFSYNNNTMEAHGIYLENAIAPVFERCITNHNSSGELPVPVPLGSSGIHLIGTVNGLIQDCESCHNQSAGSEATGIHLEGSQGVILRRVDASHNTNTTAGALAAGIYGLDSSAIIDEVVAIGNTNTADQTNGVGLELVNFSDGQVKYSSSKENNYGLRLTNVSDVRFFENNICRNTIDGVNISVEENLNFVKNVISHNGTDGVQVISGPGPVRISENCIFKNSKGVVVGCTNCVYPPRPSSFTYQNSSLAGTNPIIVPNPNPDPDLGGQNNTVLQIVKLANELTKDNAGVVSPEPSIDLATNQPIFLPTKGKNEILITAYFNYEPAYLKIILSNGNKEENWNQRSEEITTANEWVTVGFNLTKNSNGHHGNVFDYTQITIVNNPRTTPEASDQIVYINDIRACDPNECVTMFSFETATATGVTITENSIYDNKLIGIDLGDDGISENQNIIGTPGPNNWQNKPVLELLTIEKCQSQLQGYLESVANEAFIIEVFSTTCDPSVNPEGRDILASEYVITNNSGRANFGASFANEKQLKGTYLTATATRISTGDTSEFSSNLYEVIRAC